MERLRLYTLFPLALISTQANATSEHYEFLDLSLEDLLNVSVTTTSKYSEKTVDSPANIHVITAKQINNRGYRNLEDLLKNLPGVDLQEYSVIGGYNVVSMRGNTNNNKFIILKDGVRISTPAGEVNAIANNYPLYLAKRVEVLIGPAAVNYGADAFAGVINIITFDENDESQGNATLAVGDDKYLSSHVLFSKLLNNDIYFNVGLQGHYSQEYTFAKDYPELYNDQDKDYKFKNTDGFHFFADAVINDFFNTGVSHSKMTYSSDFTATTDSSAFDHSLLEESLTTLYANFTYNFNKNFHSETLFTYQLFTLGNASNFNNFFTDFTKQYKYGRTARYSLNQDFTYQLNESHLLSGGFVYDYFDIIPKSPDLPSPYDVEKKPNEQNFVYPNTDLAISFFQQRDENIGLYIQDNWQINEQWRQVSGIRFDHHTLYGDTANPSLSTIYQPNSTNVFKLLYAHSFLAPPSNQAFNSFGVFTGEKNDNGEWLSSPSLPFRVPNEQLEPEKVKSIELNYEHWFSATSKIKFATFYNKIDDVISESDDLIAKQAIVGAELINTNSFKNIGTSKTYGFDINANFNNTFENSQLEYWVALSYIDGELAEQNVKTDLPLVANYKIKAGLTYSYLQKYKLTPLLRWISETNSNNLIQGSENSLDKIDSYFVVDVNGEAQLSEQFILKLSINNLFDERYYNAPFDSNFSAFNKAPQLGRLVYATLAYNF